MLDGCYTITLQTLLGSKPGWLVLETGDTDLQGVLTLLGIDNPFAGGRSQGDEGEFSGVIRTLFGKFDYSARVRIEGDRLLAWLDTTRGKMTMTGLRRSALPSPDQNSDRLEK